MRGEQSMFVIPSRREKGSPPLARGTGHCSKPGIPQRRITPACAGNSIKYLEEQAANQDHPRLRGEQLRCAVIFDIGKGSPPLARGTVHALTIREFRSRITPACAGNSNLRGISNSRAWDHPRLRGEQLICRPAKKALLGSPPLARGTAFGMIPRKRRYRITPACAGNSQPPSAATQIR